MLVISRKKDQKIMLTHDIEITVLDVGRNRVRFGIKAPKEVTIHTHLKNAPPASDIANSTESVVTPSEPAQAQETEKPDMHLSAGSSKPFLA